MWTIDEAIDYLKLKPSIGSQAAYKQVEIRGVSRLSDETDYASEYLQSLGKTVQRRLMMKDLFRNCRVVLSAVPVKALCCAPRQTSHLSLDQRNPG